MSTWDLIAGLPLEVESYDLEGLSQNYGSFERLTTVVRLRGKGEEGQGEDVIYDGLDHVAFQDAGAVHDLAGSHTMASFGELLDSIDLFGGDAPVRDVSANYRRWAFDSAALDLALRQAGRTLGELVGREPRSLTYVVSMRLGALDSDEPETADRALRLLERYPGTRLKLDPTNTWSDELIAQLAETGAVDSLDLKGQYKGTPVDVDTDPELYRKLAEAFPDAWLEDPDLSVPEADEVLKPHRDRITWDAIIHSVDDIEALPFAPKMVNLKPSRLGPLENLCHAYDYCEERGMGAYGGGQSELGVGRGQIQLLASIFHPDTPNDVAPAGFNLLEPPEGMPTSPMGPPPEVPGFRWEQ